MNNVYEHLQLGDGKIQIELHRHSQKLTSREMKHSTLPEDDYVGELRMG
jgi:hypothetical protein